MSKREKGNKLVIPDRCSASTTVKWTKKDDLDKLAKKHGLKSGKEIWEADSNKTLVKKRKKKENLEPGDELNIPVSKAVEKRLRAEVEKYNKTKRESAAYADQLEARIDEIEKKLEEMYKHIGKKSMDNLEGAKSKQFVDSAIMFTGTVESMLGSLSSIQTPVGALPLKLNSALSIAGALKDYERSMKGGTMDQKMLENLQAKAAEAKKEIAGLRKQITQIDKFLDEAGTKTIHAFCKESNTLGWLGEAFKAAGLKLSK